MKPSTAWSITALAIVTVACTAGPAPAQPVQCPDTVRVRHDVLSQGDWKAVRAESEHRLTSIGLTDGPADEGAFLQPTSVRVVKTIRTVTFSFDSDGSDSAWLSCAYEGTSATVTRKIPKRVTVCQVSYTEGTSGKPPAPQVTCR